MNRELVSVVCLQKRIWAEVTAACLLILTSCGGLPDDFSTMPLTDQIQAYEQHFERLGGPLDEACSRISWHGLPAAEIMTGYLSGAREGIPRREALRIVRYIQLRGCSLKGSEVEQFLSALQDSGGLPEEAENHLLKTVLREIDQNVIVGGRRLDGLEGGPCDQ